VFQAGSSQIVLRGFRDEYSALCVRTKPSYRLAGTKSDHSAEQDYGLAAGLR
jgi:hypothetical protein